MSGELLPANGTGPFMAAGTMTQGRLYGAATLLPDGDVLLAGGDSSPTNGASASKTAELWSPGGGGSFTAAGAMHVARQAFTLTALPNGQALAVGGSPIYQTSGAAAGSKTAELYNPATGRWTLTGSMPSGRLGHTATLLPNCKVLIVGDAHTAVLYDYATGKFSTTGAEGTGTFQRSYQSATLLDNGRVLIAGGETASGTELNTASVYNPATGKFTPTANDMSAAHSQGFADLLSDGRVLVGGGFNTMGGVSAADIYDPTTNRWTATTSLPPDSYAFSVESQALQDGDVIVMGAGATPQATEIFTPSSTGSVSPPAENCSDLYSIVSVASSSQGKLTVRVAVPFGGGLKATATVPVQKGVPKAFSYGATSLSAARSGVFSLEVSPSAAAKSALMKDKTLKVDVAVTFTQPHKPALHRSSTVTARWS